MRAKVSEATSSVPLEPSTQSQAYVQLMINNDLGDGQCNACSLICWWTNQAWKKELDNCTLRLIFGKYMAKDHDYVVCLHRNRLKPAEVLNLTYCS